MTEDKQHFSHESELSDRRLSRRNLLAGAAASTATLSLSEFQATIAQDTSTDQPEVPPYGTPEATPSVSIDLEAFRTLCQNVADVDDVDLTDDSLQQLLSMILDEGSSVAGVQLNRAEGLQELLKTGGNNIDRAELSRSANATLTHILEFLYLGEFHGMSLENRSELYPSLASYQLLPYVATPAICKGAEYWTEEVDMPDRA